MKENDKNYYLTKDYFNSPLKLEDFDLYQIGRIICNEKTIYPDHDQHWEELTVINKGEGVISTNGIPLKVKEGDIYLSIKGDVHAIISSKDNPLEYDFCAFCPKVPLLNDYFSKLSLLLINEKNRIFHSSRVANLVSMGINEIQNVDKEFSLKILNSILWQLAVYSYRIIRGGHKNNFEKIKNKEILIYQIMEYISANIERISSLSELEKAFHYSYSYLSNIYKETTSKKLVDYFIEKKMELVKDLLLEGLSLDKIAARINYSSAFALSKAFKNYFGVSPREFKSRNITKTR